MEGNHLLQVSKQDRHVERVVAGHKAKEQVVHVVGPGPVADCYFIACPGACRARKTEILPRSPENKMELIFLPVLQKQSSCRATPSNEIAEGFDAHA